MKTRQETERDKAADAALKALARAFAALDKPQEAQAFLRDLCTPAELEAMADRWRVVPLLRKGVPYREIYDLTGVSVTTIGRVARSLEHGAGGYAVAIERLATRKTESN
ncbi:TrpR [Stenotrophomonas terrae]|uniref:TrpR n=1 Tax=Stenotrophomonas terrae TaxID=405446 RepID=A0A0R0C7L3_9GAMM|nr:MULTISPECIES: YerC/YecD family TrpR-related protein [Stenotrophomonas]KRG61096.1 TrpR [Stenotrophomonas terrae]